MHTTIKCLRNVLSKTITMRWCHFLTEKCHLVTNKIYNVTQHSTFHWCLIHDLTKMTMSHLIMSWTHDVCPSKPLDFHFPPCLAPEGRSPRRGKESAVEEEVESPTRANFLEEGGAKYNHLPSGATSNHVKKRTSLPKVSCEEALLCQLSPCLPGAQHADQPGLCEEEC